MISHYNNIKRFYDEHFKGLLTLDKFVGEKFLFKKPVAVFEVDRIKYIIGTEHLENFPIRINSEELMSFNSEVYHVITDYTPLKINPSQDLKLSELIDYIGGDIKHSHQDDYFAYRLLIISSYISKLRLRFSTKPHFGKDSVTWQIYLLTNSLVNFTPKTVAGVEMFLDKPLLVMNELKDLNTEQLRYVSQLLHKITDDSPVYTRGAMTKQTIGLKQQYDLSNLSVVIFYNDKEYSNKTGAYFDDLFDKPIQDRIMPFKFRGELDMNQFRNCEYSDELKNIYKKMAHSLEYYRLYLDLDMLPIPEYNDKGSIKGRHIPIFNTIKKIAKIYCDEKGIDFNETMKTILNAHLRYDSDGLNKWED